MKDFVDTSVLVAAYLEDSLHHAPSLRLMSKMMPSQGACAAHSLAETYSSLTRLPASHRAAGEQALFYVSEIQQRLTVVALGVDEYFDAIAQMASLGISGGAVYDALIARCAMKIGAKNIYTWNTRDFTRLGPEVVKKVRTP